MQTLKPNLASPIEAVIFDMDGTLLDSEAMFGRVLYRTCAAMGYEMTDAIHMTIVGSTSEQTASRLHEAFGADFPIEHFRITCNEAVKVELETSTIPAKHGALELLHFLSEIGMPLAVATSSRRNHAFEQLGHVELLPHFRTLVTRDDVVNTKPHPEPYLLAAERLGLPPSKCLAIEDSHVGARSACAAGMQTILVPDLVKPSEELARHCTAILPDLLAVKMYLSTRLAVDA